MRAGRLSKRIRVERATESKNAVGETEQTWSEYKMIWAGIEPISGKEKYTAAQPVATIDTVIITRASAAQGIKPKDRFVYKDRIFDIDSIRDWETRGVYCEFSCKEAA